MEEEKKLVHQHVLIKAYVNKPPMDEGDLIEWFCKLVDDIGMKICIIPRAKYVNVKGNRGVTGIVGIETSHCAVHVWDEVSPAMLQMDVYSCSSFEPQTVLNRLDDFDIVRYKMMHIDREDDFVVLENTTSP